MTETTQIYRVFIRSTPERIWEAITQPEFTARYFHGARIRATADGYVSHGPDGSIWGESAVAEFDPPRRLVHGWRSLYDPEMGQETESRVTWEIEQVGDDSCHLTLTHDQMREGANSQIYGGWPMILSGLKTWLETGEELTTPGSIRYS